MTTPVALTIAGSDPSGSSGLQADLPTFAALGVHGTSVLTLISAQNSQGIQALHDLPPEQVVAQLDALLADMAPTATKTGLLFRAANVELVIGAAAKLGTLVVDPVMVDSAGDLIVEASVVERYRALCASAAVITPNRREAELLIGHSSPLDSASAIEGAADQLLDLGATTVVVTGGRGTGPEVADVVVSADRLDVFAQPRVEHGPFRGTGCTLSAALTALLARGVEPHDAVREAQTFVQRQLLASTTRIGAGRQGITHVFVRE